MKKLSLTLNAAFLIFFFWYFFIHVGIAVYYRKYVEPETIVFNDTYYKAKVSQYASLNKQLAADQDYTVFVGDSFIEQFPVTELFPGFRVLNRGIGFDTSVGVLNRLENTVNNITVTSCFLMIGHNDLKYRSVKDISQNIELIASRIKAKRIFIISILPCAEQLDNYQISQINNIIKKRSSINSYTYIDCYNHFLSETGKIKSEYYYDGVHLNMNGYVLLKQCIEHLLSPTA
jgi:lysophospholipase L1-like esterase